MILKVLNVPQLKLGYTTYTPTLRPQQPINSVVPNKPPLKFHLQLSIFSIFMQ